MCPYITGMDDNTLTILANGLNAAESAHVEAIRTGDTKAIAVAYLNALYAQRTMCVYCGDDVSALDAEIARAEVAL